MKIAIDIMNGDLSPSSTIIGALSYINKNKNDFLYLVGKKATFHSFRIDFKKSKYNNYKFIYAEDEILPSDSPTRLFRKKPDSSLIKSIQLLKDKEVDGVVSAGNTGALLSSSL